MVLGSNVTVAARPAAVALDPARTAVIVVDMQNHFASPGGTFANAGIDTAPILALVDPIRDVLAAARSVSVRVIYLRVNAPATPVPAGETALRRTPDGEMRWRHYVDLVATGGPAGQPRESASPTWNADIVDGLAPLPDDIVVTKPRFSGFYHTDLDDILKSLGIEDLIFTGCTTSVCVESTLRDAHFRGYRCLLLGDCVAEPIGAGLSRTNHDATLYVTELLFGYVSDSAAVCAALQSEAVAAT